MQFFIGIMAGVFVAIVCAVAYVAGLHQKTKPTLPKTVDELEIKREKQMKKDFNAMMNYNADIATQRQVGE